MSLMHATSCTARSKARRSMDGVLVVVMVAMRWVDVLAKEKQGRAMSGVKYKGHVGQAA